MCALRWHALLLETHYSTFSILLCFCCHLSTMTSLEFMTALLWRPPINVGFSNVNRKTIKTFKPRSPNTLQCALISVEIAFGCCFLLLQYSKYKYLSRQRILRSAHDLFLVVNVKPTTLLLKQTSLLCSLPVITRLSAVRRADPTLNLLYGQ